MDKNSVIPVIVLLSALVVSCVVLCTNDSSDDEPASPEYMVSSTMRLERYADDKVVGNSTGFIIDHNGIFFLTCGHVVDYEGEFTYRSHFYGEPDNKYELELLDYDMSVDIAVMKFKDSPPNVPVFKFGDSEHLEFGQEISHVGNGEGLGLAFYKGVVSDPFGRPFIEESGKETFIKIDIGISPGCSGGPLFNLDGEVIGMISYRLSTFVGGENVGFAVRSYVMMQYLDLLDLQEGISDE